MEAVISLEIEVPSSRTENYDEDQNIERLHSNLDFLKKKRERATLKMVAYQHRVARYYNF